MYFLNFTYFNKKTSEIQAFFCCMKGDFLVEEQRETLYIPTNIKTKQEFFSGYGFMELMKTLVMAALGLIVGLMIYAKNQNISTVILIVMVVISATIVCVSKDRNNQSIVDYVDNMIKFSRSQKIYRYIRKEDVYNVYEHI